MTVLYLQNKMQTFLTDIDALPYGKRYIKLKLKEQYGDSVHFVEQGGLHDIVTMRENTSRILRSYFNDKPKDEKSQINAIIEAAARLIKSDIKSDVPSNTDFT